MLTKEEVDLVRLLRCTEDLVESALQRRIEPPYSIKVFQKYVATLFKSLSDLESRRNQQKADHVSQNAATVTGAAERSSTSNPISNEAIADFRRRIEFLLRVVYSDEFKTSVHLASQEGSSADSSSLLLNGRSSQSHESTSSNLKSTVQQESRRQLGLQDHSSQPIPGFESHSHQESEVQTKEKASLVVTQKTQTPKKLGAESKTALIDHHRHIQDEYTDEMLHYTSQLKQQARLTSKIVSDQISTLDKLDTKLDQNSDAASVANHALNELFESSSGSIWFHWTIIMTASLMFAAMYIFMKIFPKIPTET